MRWREKFFWVKVCDNELGGHLPHTLCSPQLPPIVMLLDAARNEHVLKKFSAK